MVKKVQVVIKTNKFTEHKKGSVVSVSAGYAFNYLIPKNIAEIATHKTIKHLNMFSKIEEKKQKTDLIATEKIKNKIVKVKKIAIYKKKGENYSIFGSVKEKEISDWVEKYTNVKLENKQIKLDDKNKIGISLTNIQIKQDINIEIKLCNLPNNI